MKRCAVVVSISLAVLAASAARGEDIGHLQREYSQAIARWSNEAATQPMKRAAHPAMDFMPRFLALAQEGPGQPQALQSLSWIVGNSQMAFRDPQEAKLTLLWAIGEIGAHHSKDAGVVELIPNLRNTFGFVGSKPLAELFATIARDQPGRSVQATALFSQAIMLLNDPSAVENKKRGLDVLRKIAADYKDTGMAEQASSILFEIENLQIGCKAPEIEGEDADGKKIRLSQFKGQVVVLDFWGFW